MYAASSLHFPGWDEMSEKSEYNSDDVKKIPVAGEEPQQDAGARADQDELERRGDDQQEAGADTPQAESASAEDEVLTVSAGEYETLRSLARERDEYAARLVRAVADYQNLTKRIEKRQRQTEQETLKNVMLEILHIADSLALAMEAAENAQGSEDILQGLDLIAKEFYATLEKFGVVPVDAVGKPFDPHYHDAVMRQPSESAQPNIVLREIKKGFMIGKDLLRPSQVIVSVAPGEAEEEGE